MPRPVTDYDEVISDNVTEYDEDPTASPATAYAMANVGGGGGSGSGASTKASDAPFDTDWIGYTGFICEITESNVLVRGYVDYSDVKVKKKGKKQAHQNYEKVRAKKGSGIQKLAKRMREMAKLAAGYASKFRALNQQFAIETIFFAPDAIEGYRLWNGKGAIVLKTSQVIGTDEWKSVVAHETAHGILESHSAADATGERDVDLYASHIGALYLKMAATKKASLPTTSFAKAKPKLGNVYGCGYAFVADVLWSGYVSHGHGTSVNVDEWHASALGGWLYDAALMDKIARWYGKYDSTINEAADTLWRLFGTLGDEQAMQDLTMPYPYDTAEAEMKSVALPFAVSTGATAGRVAWVADPTQLPTPTGVTNP